MPTAKPRITLTLTDRQHELLSSLSSLQKVSMSSIVVDLLETTVPVLERLIAVLHNAATAPQAVLDQLKQSAESAELDLNSLQSSFWDAVDEVVEESGSAPARATRSGVRAGGPPTSNRGVRNVPPASENRSISPSKSRTSNDSNERAKK